MNNEYTAIVKKEGNFWVGWIEEIPGVNCQEKTREALMETLNVTLKEALLFNKDDALASAGVDFEEEKYDKNSSTDKEPDLVIADCHNPLFVRISQ